MEQIRCEVNRHFFLGLFEYEAHFAKYEAGDFYLKHLDSFRGNENRKLTTVFYLNENWTPADGGELKIYDLQDNWIETLAPLRDVWWYFFRNDSLMKCSKRMRTASVSRAGFEPMA